MPLLMLLVTYTCADRQFFLFIQLNTIYYTEVDEYQVRLHLLHSKYSAFNLYMAFSALE
jgi:hypothetical protein